MLGAQACVVGNTLWLFGGTIEIGDKEVTLDDMWSLDLNKLDGCVHLLLLSAHLVWPLQTYAHATQAQGLATFGNRRMQCSEAPLCVFGSGSCTLRSPPQQEPWGV